MEARYFIHPEIGNDDNVGTIDAPLRTMQGLAKAIITDEKINIAVCYYFAEICQWRQL